jgi:hypothetical protein
VRFGLIPPEVTSDGEKAIVVALERNWHELHVATLSGISSHFELRPVAGASHRVQDSNPEAVVGAVREVIMAAGNR